MSRIHLESVNSEESLKLSRRSRFGRRLNYILENESSDEDVIVDKENIDAVDPIEKLKERLLNALDEAEEKSGKIRTQALKTISELLIHYYVPELIQNRKIAFTDIIEKGLHHGKAAEQLLAAKIRLLLQFQLGDGYKPEAAVDQYIVDAIKDETCGYLTRAECCNVLALLHFLQYDDDEDLMESMEIFEGIFKNIEKSISEDESILYSTALLSWGLLLTKLSPGYIKKPKQIMPCLIKMLESQYLILRVAAGETICLILECGRAVNENFMYDVLPNLIAITKSLSTDSQRHRHKQELKSQRATFRDILRYIENDIQPNVKIQIGSESIALDSWAIHHQYMSLCAVIGPGIVAQLSNNQYVRNILQLGEIPLANLKNLKIKSKKCIKTNEQIMGKKNRQNRNKPDFRY